MKIVVQIAVCLTLCFGQASLLRADPSESAPDMSSGAIKAAAEGPAGELADCVMNHAWPRIYLEASEEMIVDDALKLCSGEIRAVTTALMGPPTHFSEKEAQRGTAEVVLSMRKKVMNFIRYERHAQPPT